MRRSPSVVKHSLALATLLLALPVALRAAEASAKYSRNVEHGLKIPDEGYCDQPYIVVTDDGNWVCVLTTGRGVEGQRGQHVVSTISTDQGRSWSELVDIEPADGPEASWAVPLVTPGGRIYAFYTYNGDKIDSLNGRPIRTDVLGWYAYKYSDDGGRSWSAQRRRLPLPLTACDRTNDWQGEVQMFWGICKPQIAGGDVLFSFARYGLKDGPGVAGRRDLLELGLVQVGAGGELTRVEQRALGGHGDDVLDGGEQGQLDRGVLAHGDGDGLEDDRREAVQGRFDAIGARGEAEEPELADLVRSLDPRRAATRQGDRGARERSPLRIGDDTVNVTGLQLRKSGTRDDQAHEKSPDDHQILPIRSHDRALPW